METTHFKDIPLHTFTHKPFLFIRTPYEVFICAMLLGIKMDFHLNAIVASGNATLDLVAFLSTDNGTTKPVRYKTRDKNASDTYRATADHLMLYQYRFKLTKD